MTTPPNQSYSLSVPRNAVRGLTVLILVLVVLAVGIAVGIELGSNSSSDALSSQVNTSQYQAVFLTSNEVYFGKLSVPSGDFAYMTNVYRLTSQVTHNQKQPLKRTLVRLITDIHGPEDELILNKSQILYIENLNPNGTAAKLLQQSNAAP
jgi:hypothetical protein